MGRDRELAVLEGVLRSASDGRAAQVLVVGEPGVGKTALLGPLVEDARRRGVRVVSAAGVPAERHVAGGVLGVLAAQLAPGGAEPASGPEALLWMLWHVDGAVLVVADDVHWWDRLSTAALVFAARRLSADPVALVAAGRPESLEDAGLASLPRLELGPVPRPLAGELVRTAVAGTHDDVARSLWTAVGGNTLALLEAAARLRPEQREGRARIPDDVPVGPGVVQRWAADVEGLPETTRRALTALAVADDEECLTAVLAASGASTDDLVPAEACRLVLLDGPPRFRHPLARLAVVGRSDPALVRALHGRCADALAALPISQHRVHRHATHRAAAVTGFDDASAAALRADADELHQAGALRAEADVLELAAAVERDPDAAADLLCRAARRCLEDFDDGSAVRLARAGLDRGPGGAARGRLLQVCGLATSRVEDTAAGTAMIREAVQLLDEEERRTALCDLLFAMDLTAERDGTVGALIDQLGDVDRLPPLGRLVVAHSADHAGTDPRARERMTQALADLRVEDATSSGWATETVVNASLDLGLDVSGRRLADVTDTLMRSCDPRRRLDGLGLDMLVAYWQGRWNVLVDEAQETVELCAALSRVDLYSDAVRLQVLTRRGDRSGAEAASTRAREVMGDAGMDFWTGALPGETAVLELTLGRAEPAAAVFATEPVDALAQLVPHTIYAEHLVNRVEVLADLGRRDDAVEADRLLDRLLGPETSTLGRAQRARAHAAVADDADVHDLLVAAEELTDVGVDVFGLAVVRLRLARWLRRHRRKAEARDRLLLALATFTALSCPHWERRCVDELAAVGYDAPRIDRYDVTGTLTAQERRVAEVVAEGCSNDEVARRLFLSPRTVEVHLTHVYRKLGVRGRSELVRHWLGATSAREVTGLP